MMAGEFGTLLVQLPSFYTGGDIVVEHEWRRERFSHSGNNSIDNGCWYTVFFNDCKFTMEPVASGLKVLLCFALTNLSASPSSRARQPPRCDVDYIKRAVSLWRREVGARRFVAIPVRLIHLVFLNVCSFGLQTCVLCHS